MTIRAIRMRISTWAFDDPGRMGGARNFSKELILKKTLWAALLAAGTMVSAAADAETLRIGVLPAADAIVIHAAADEKLFKAQGLDVEVIPFKSALELGAAMRAGRLDGHFGDLMNVFTQNERGVAQAVILTTTHTSKAQRAFGLVVSPAAEGIRSLKDLDGTETAMSSATIIDYLLDRMKAEEKLPAGALKNLEVKQIPIRLQMLQTGKVATAMLPEPLVSVVEAKGGRVIWDDRSLDEALAVVALKKEKLDDKTVFAFRRAVADAARLIESEPDRFRAVMVKKGLLPAPVAQNYTMVRFSMFGTSDGLPPLPSAEDVRRVGEWMVAKHMIKAVPAYESVVIRP